MSRGNGIIKSANPQGKFEECLISGTPTPGVCVELKTATAEKNGRFTYQVVSRASGAIGPVAVLLGDELQGKLDTGAQISTFSPYPAAPGDAYVTLTRAFIYWPIAGEELNMVVASVAGTADDVAIGDLFGIEQNTGKLKANNSYAALPFEALEAVVDPTADYLLFCRYRGNQA